MRHLEDWARRAGIAGDEWPQAQRLGVEGVMTLFWAVLFVIYAVAA